MTFKTIHINDPIYGSISINNKLIYEIIETSYFQRLRRIQQMSVAHLTFPGSMHTRFHHSLGAYHLMTLALKQLINKGVQISEEEFLASQIAILLHDIGHGPFSHTLEGTLLQGINHEQISLKIMEILNHQFNHQLDLAIQIFTNQYQRKFFHQLISSQLDVDRLDYLTRDSFYSGVAEGIIGYDRIIRLFNVYNDNLVIEEKGIYTIERFLISRTIMYWQVYYHKTVWATEQLIINIFNRLKEMYTEGKNNFIEQTDLELFFKNKIDINNLNHIKSFCELDDIDIIQYIKEGQKQQEDKILFLLCDAYLNRKLYHVEISDININNNNKVKQVVSFLKDLNIDEKYFKYFIIEKQIINSIYEPSKEKINIISKNPIGIKDIFNAGTILLKQSINLNQSKYYKGFWRT